MKLIPESIRVNDIELANEVIWVMNGTAIKQADEIESKTATNDRQSLMIYAKDRQIAELTRMLFALGKQDGQTIRTMKEAIEDVKYYVGNPSAWEHYDDGVSEKIRAILKAAGMA